VTPGTAAMKTKAVSIKGTLLLLCALAMAVCSTTDAFAKRHLKVSINPVLPPFSFLDKSESTVRVRGFSVDYINMIAKLMHADVDFYASGEMFEQKTRRDLDIKALGFKQQAGEQYAFVPIHVNFTRCIFVGANCTTITCRKDFLHKKIVVLAEDYYGEELSDSGSEIVTVNSILDAIHLLDNGIVDAFPAPSERATHYIIQKEKQENIRKVGLPIEAIPMGILVKKGDAALIAGIRDAVLTLEKRGVVDELKDKWFGKQIELLDWKALYRPLAIIFMVVIAGLGGILFWNYILKKRVAQATMDLKHSRQQYMELIESSPDMIFLVDRDGEIILTNHKGKSIIQGEKEDGGHTLFDLTCAEDHGILKNLLNSIYNLGSAKDEIRFAFPGDEVKDMDLAASLIHFEWQSKIFACCFARDVTERNQFENSLIKSERLVVIGKMAAAVAHEINNPIGIVLANADEILDAELTPEETRECLESIQRNAIRAGEITRNLLSLSKPEKMTLCKVDFVDIVNLSLKFMRPKLKDVKVDVIYPEETQSIFGDFKFLQQAVVNIILNAISAMEGAHRKNLTVRFCKKLRQQNVRLIFEDTGKGIPRENLVQIFEPFFSNGKENSFGLGLFTVNRIIEKHDGIVFAESDPGKGTKIVVELPRYADKECC